MARSGGSELSLCTLLALLGESEPTTLRQGYGSLLFTICFLLVLILAVLWWLKRNYM